MVRPAVKAWLALTVVLNQSLSGEYVQQKQKQAEEDADQPSTDSTLRMGVCAGVFRLRCMSFESARAPANKTSQMCKRLTVCITG